MLSRRILTVLVILPLFLAGLFWLPQRLWGGAMLIVVAVACSEWARLAGLETGQRQLVIVVVVVACLLLGFYSQPLAGELLLGAALAFWLAIAPLWLGRRLNATAASVAAAGGLILISAWYALFVLQQSAGRLLVLLGVVWVADTAAYFVGRRFGRRKLAPSISPGKTWEGVVGAVLGVGVYYGLLWFALAPPFLAGQRGLDLVLVAGMTALSVEGDLLESWVKRRAGVKDSGTILPGHGGVLDRIDGVVAALPLAALAAVMGRG